ncbi:MAG: hypothetical protein AAFP90_09060, partial [Planctomycetota bacterium]
MPLPQPGPSGSDAGNGMAASTDGPTLAPPPSGSLVPATDAQLPTLAPLPDSPDGDVALGASEDAIFSASDQFASDHPYDANHYVDTVASARQFDVFRAQEPGVAYTPYYQTAYFWLWIAFAVVVLLVVLRSVWRRSQKSRRAALQADAHMQRLQNDHDHEVTGLKERLDHESELLIAARAALLDQQSLADRHLADADRLRQQLAALKGQNQQQENQLRSLRSIADDAQSLAADHATLTDEMRASEEQLQTVQQRHRTLYDQHAQLQSDFESLQNELPRVTADGQSWKTQYETTMGTLQSERMQHRRVTDENQQLQSGVNELAQQVERLESQATSSTQQHQRDAQQIEELLQEIQRTT